MKLLCFRANSKIILDSPDRENIKISTKCIPNKDNLENVFRWLIDMLREKKENTPRHIIFCESIGDVAKIYSMFVKLFGNKCDLFEMFHSKTGEKVKEQIRNDMTINGNIRILICTNAAGMGVNFHNVHNIVHYNIPRQMDTFVQQMGRGGRDGHISDELILFKTHKGHLNKCENDLIRLAKDDTKCKHELLCSSYLITHKTISPCHNCCDVCEKTCSCGSEECPRTHQALKEYPSESDSDSSEEEMKRPVTDHERKLLKQKLMSFKFTLTSSTAGAIIDAEVIHGLTDDIVMKIVENCETVFTSDDVISKFPIWSCTTAVEISNIISDVFGDTELYNLLEDTEEESG